MLSAIIQWNEWYLSFCLAPVLRNVNLFNRETAARELAARREQRKRIDKGINCEKRNRFMD
jgi:hypothetical protein